MTHIIYIIKQQLSANWLICQRKPLGSMIRPLSGKSINIYTHIHWNIKLYFYRNYKFRD